MLPTPTHITTVSSMEDYHIFTFGDEASGVFATTVFSKGQCRDSYLVVGSSLHKPSYITLDFQK